MQWLRWLLVGLVSGGFGFVVGRTSIAPLLVLPQFGDESPVAGEVVARVGDVPIYADELRRTLVRTQGYTSDRLRDPALKQAALDDLIRTKLLAAAGRAAGYASDTEIVATLDRLLADRFLRDLAAANPPLPPVSDDDVRVYYEQHLPDFTPVDRARASVLLLAFPDDPTPEQKDAVRRRIEDLRQRALAEKDVPGSFVGLVQENSADTMTRLRGGDLGWMARGQNPRPVYGALVEPIFALENVGDISTPVETKQGYAIVRLTDRTRPEPRPLAAVEDEIRPILEAKRQQEINDLRYAQLKERFSVTVDQNVLSGIAADTPNQDHAARPPAIPGVPGPPPAAAGID